MHIDTLVYAMVLQGPDHLQSGAISYVRQPGISVSSEVPLQNAPILRPVEDSTPRLQFFHAIWSFFGMQLGHAPLIDILAAAHRIGEMDPPIVAIIHIRERG